MDNLQQTIMSKISSTIHTPTRVRDLIRQIRSARTQADIRSVVQKECAYIRTTFRQEDNVWRCRNVVKLLYIHMLGFPAHFGQLECLKLIASHRFTDKRIGYLGAMLLLDENQEVHLLITNSLQNDLNSSEQFIVGLALCALGAICSSGMARDLSSDIERLMRSSSSYIKKKAVICAARMIRKVPELLENFLPATNSLLSDSSHGVLIASMVLITEMCEQSQDALEHFRKTTPRLVRLIKSLLMSGNSPDYDVNCISDPFLQVKIIRLLRVLGKNNLECSEQMADVLTSIATNTESSKNVGNAVLYETVLTMMEVHPDTGLRELAINTLGRFLLNMDKNVRYVALETFLKTAHSDYSFVQRHRVTIVECLRDMDVSIQKKAMELSFFLINSNNFKSMSKDLLLFLERADSEYKAICASNLCLSAEKFASGARSQFDIVMKVMTIAGNCVQEDVVGNLCQLISANPSMHSYCVRQLWNQLNGDLSLKQPFVQAATWCLGEYSSLINDETGLTVEDKLSHPPPQKSNTDSSANYSFDLFGNQATNDPDLFLFQNAPKPTQISTMSKESDSSDTEEASLKSYEESSAMQPVSGDDIIRKCQSIIEDPKISITTKEYTINALFKLSVRFPEHSHQVKIIADNISTNLNLEMQQRSIEYSTIFTKHENLLGAIFDEMPVIEKSSQYEDEEEDVEEKEQAKEEVKEKEVFDELKDLF